MRAESEITALHEKLDHLLHSQGQRRVDLQQIRIDILQDLDADRVKKA